MKRSELQMFETEKSCTDCNKTFAPCSSVYAFSRDIAFRSCLQLFSCFADFHT